MNTHHCPLPQAGLPLTPALLHERKNLKWREPPLSPEDSYKPMYLPQPMAALYTLEVAPQFVPNKLICFVFLSKEWSCSIVSLPSFPGINQYHFTPVDLSFSIEILWFPVDSCQEMRVHRVPDQQCEHPITDLLLTILAAPRAAE